MSLRYRSFFRGVVLSWVALSSLQGMEECALDGFQGLPKNIQVKPLVAYEELLSTHDDEALKNPSDTFFLLTDWDCTVTAISDFDHKNFPRQENTGNVIDSFKKRNVPVAVVTARWKHKTNPLEDLVRMASSMEANTGICVSDQEPFKDLTFDLRNGSLNRGIFIQGICFTGSTKGPVTAAFIDHPAIIKATHYFFVDDDLEKITQMVEIFKGRQEKLTAFYYPNKLEKEMHPPILLQLLSFPSVQTLSFLIRHNYASEIQQLLENGTLLPELRAANPIPLLVDLVHSDGEEVARHVMEKLEFDIQKLDLDEILALLGLKLTHAKHRPLEPLSIKWILKDLHPNTLLSVSLHLLSRRLPSPLLQQCFDSVPNPSSLILDIFSYIPSQGSSAISNMDPFDSLLGAGIIKKELIPELESRAEENRDHEVISRRLLKAKAQIQ